MMRPYQMPDGSARMVAVRDCRCGPERRGPAGGVCGACGGAIPDAPALAAPRELAP